VGSAVRRRRKGRRRTGWHVKWQAERGHRVGEETGGFGQAEGRVGNPSRGPQRMYPATRSVPVASDHRPVVFRCPAVTVSITAAGGVPGPDPALPHRRMGTLTGRGGRPSPVSMPKSGNRGGKTAGRRGPAGGE